MIKLSAQPRVSNVYQSKWIHVHIKIRETGGAQPCQHLLLWELSVPISRSSISIQPPFPLAAQMRPLAKWRHCTISNCLLHPGVLGVQTQKFGLPNDMKYDTYTLHDLCILVYLQICNHYTERKHPFGQKGLRISLRTSTCNLQTSWRGMPPTPTQLCFFAHTHYSAPLHS